MLARGLAELDPADASGEAIGLKLQLSTWMRRAGVDPGQARRQLIGLRAILLDVCDLDRASEPVPLVGPDDRRSVLNLAFYVHELIGRAAHQSGRSPSDLVERALSAA